MLESCLAGRDLHSKLTGIPSLPNDEDIPHLTNSEEDEFEQSNPGEQLENLLQECGRRKAKRAYERI